MNLQVQPDLDLLEENMEENEAAQREDESKEPDKLGRLQFKLDYDFQQNQVSWTLSSRDASLLAMVFFFLVISWQSR